MSKQPPKERRIASVTIELPEDDALVLLAFAEHLVKAIKNARVRTEQVKVDTTYEEHQVVLRERNRKLGARVYHAWRRLDPSLTHHQRHKLLAKDLRIDHVYAEFLLKGRRNEVKEYLKKRRTQSAIRLCLAGWSDEQIGKYIGRTKRTVQLLLRDNREHIRAQVGSEHKDQRGNA